MTTVAHLTSVHGPRDPRIFVKECRTLAAAGYDVVLVAPQAGSGVEDGVRFVEFHKPANRLARILFSGRRMTRVAGAIPAEVFHIHDSELLPTAHRLARRGATVVYDSHEHLTKSTAGKTYLHPLAARLVAGLVGRYEHFVASRLAAVVAATPTIAEQFDPDRTVVVANYPVASEWTDGDGPGVEDYLARPRRAAYVGAITAVRCAPELVAVAAELARSDGELHFAGPVSGTPVPEGPGVVHHGVIAREEVSDLLDTTRVGMVVFRPIPNHIEALPTKAFEYMAAGLPIVVASATEVLADMVRDTGCGVVVPHDRPLEIAAAVERLFDEPLEAYEMGRRGRQAVLDHHTWDSQGEVLVELYRRLAPVSAGR